MLALNDFVIEEIMPWGLVSDRVLSETAGTFAEWFKGRAMCIQGPMRYRLRRNHGLSQYAPKKAWCCWENAQSLAQWNAPRVECWDGIVIAKRNPRGCGHGWNRIAGEWVDRTWSDGVEYHGLHVPHAHLNRIMAVKGVASPLVWYLWAMETGLIDGPDIPFSRERYAHIGYAA